MDNTMKMDEVHGRDKLPHNVTGFVLSKAATLPDSLEELSTL